MGLDNYAVYGKEHPKYNHDEGASNDIPNELFPQNTLCGGMFSGGGNSFRGKVYNEVVEFFTGYSLYEELLSPNDVKHIYTQLVDVDESRFIFEFEGENTWGITYKEVKELTEWFGTVASENGSVIGWW